MPKIRRSTRPIGAALKRARHRRHKTLAEVGKEVGVSGETIRLWEAGRHLPKLPMVEAWRRAVLTPEELVS